MAPKRKPDAIPTDHEQARKDIEQLTQSAQLPTFENTIPNFDPGNFAHVKLYRAQKKLAESNSNLAREMQRANDLKEREQSKPAKPPQVEFSKIVFSPDGKDKFLSLLEKLDCVTIEGGRYIISADTEEAAGRWVISIFIRSHLNGYIFGFLGKRENPKKQMMEEIKHWKLITANFSYRLKTDNSIRPFVIKRLNKVLFKFSETENVKTFECIEMEIVENIKL